MSFKFFVGQAVENTLIGEKTAGLYKIVRQVPKEERAFDLRYLIKSEAEVYERNVLECQLSSDVRPESNMRQLNLVFGRARTKHRASKRPAERPLRGSPRVAFPFQNP